MNLYYSLGNSLFLFTEKTDCHHILETDPEELLYLNEITAK